jgi:hypothetical protein
MICWVMSSVKVYVVSLWMGILAIAMLLCPYGLLQRFCVVTVELLTLHDHKTRMHAADWLAEGISPGHRQKLPVCSRMRSGGHGKQSARQAEDRRRSQGLIIDHQTTRFHPLDFLREDGRELQPKDLHQLRDRYPHSAAQFGYNEFLR